MWLLLIYVSEVFYVRVKDINFKLVKKLKDNLDVCIEGLLVNFLFFLLVFCIIKKVKVLIEWVIFGGIEFKYLFVKINECKFKFVVLSLIEFYFEQFIMKSRSILIIFDFFDLCNFDLLYLEFLEKCENIDLIILELQVELIE